MEEVCMQCCIHTPYFTFLLAFAVGVPFCKHAKFLPQVAFGLLTLKMSNKMVSSCSFLRLFYLAFPPFLLGLEFFLPFFRTGLEVLSLCLAHRIVVRRFFFQHFAAV